MRISQGKTATGIKFKGHIPGKKVYEMEVLWGENEPISTIQLPEKFLSLYEVKTEDRRHQAEKKTLKTEARDDRECYIR